MSANHPDPRVAPPALGNSDETLDSTPARAGASTDGGDPAFAETMPPGAAAPAGELPEEVPGYELIAELGRGAMGVVFHARQRVLNRPVALKMVLGGEYAGSEKCVRFLTEAEVIARLRHPNIVQIYELGRHRGVPFFSLEYMEGGSLDRQLDGHPWPPEKAARAAQTLAGAIQAAHDNGVVHRDLKPGNVLLGADGTLKVTDFGLAKQVEVGSGLTNSGAIMGTPSYMAPEQARGDVHAVGPAADIHALGAILYELLTGRPPFRAGTALDTVVQVVGQEPVAPRALVPKVPRDLETICLKCLQKDPKNRYATAAALADDLGRFLAGEPIAARPVPRVVRALRWARRRPAAAALLAVSALSLAALLLGGAAHNRRLAAALADATEQRAEAERQKRLALENLGEADRQKQIALANLKEAREQRAEAERQRQLAVANLGERLDMVDGLLFNIDERLANYEGARTLRHEFLDEARKLNAKLLQDQPGDERIRRQAGRIAQKLGEVQERAKPAAARASLTRAIELQRQLVDGRPGEVTYRADLMASYARRGHVNVRLGRPADALADFGGEKELADRLIREVPEEIDYRDWAAAARGNIGNVLEALGKTAEAVTAYREAAELAAETARRKPTPAYVARGSAAAAALGYALEKTAPDEARAWFRKAIAACRLGADSAPVRAEMKAAYHDLAHHLRRRHDHAGLAALAAEYARDFPDSGNETYNAACYLGHAVEAAQKAPGLGAAERARLVDGYAKQVLDTLQRSIEQGAVDLAHMAVDTDLDPLRGRADYQSFVALQEKRFPAKAVTPAALLAKLQSNFTGLHRQHQARLARSTPLERRRAALDRPDFGHYAGRALDLAEKNPELPAALAGVTWVLQAGAEAAAPLELPEIRRRAVELLRKDHLGKPAVTEVCRLFAEDPSPEGDRLLQHIADRGGVDDLKGLAAYSLGLSLMQQAEAARSGDGAAADKLAERAAGQLELVIAKYGSAWFDGESLGAAARKKLDKLRRLSVGRTAPEIEGVDLDGKPFKLSDYRGRVVLLDFWANWCGYCRQMFPGEKALVERLKGRPFALVGVNCDDSKESALRAVRQEKLNWRSWFDVGGAKIATAWQVDGFPRLYLIDPKGVIRRNWDGYVDAAQVDAAVDALLREVEGAARKP